MRVLLLAAAGAAVRGQLDAGLRSRIRFPPQLPGRYVVWEGHPRVGLGNVLAGWGDCPQTKAITRPVETSPIDEPAAPNHARGGGVIRIESPRVGRPRKRSACGS